MKPSARGPGVEVLSLLAFTHDVLAAAAAWVLAYWLRLNLSIAAEYHAGMYGAMLVCIPLQACVCQGVGLYRGVWRYASLPDLRRIVFAVGAGALACPFMLLMLGLNVGVPRSVFLLEPALLLLLMGGSRAAYRSWKEHRLFGVTRRQGSPVLVIGTGDAAITLTKELIRSPDWRVVGLVDDDPRLLGRTLESARVVGGLDALADTAARLAVTHVIIALPEASHRERRHIVDLCRSCRLKVLTIPSFDDLMSGKVQVSAVREVELDDLLGRDPVVLDCAGLKGLLLSRTVMVTGAGGSIGSELVRQIVRFKPALLILVENSEFPLYSIEQELGRVAPAQRFVCVIGDVRDATRMGQVLGLYRPSVLFHAAAYKHVAMMEDGNAGEALANNVCGTATLSEAAIAAGVARFVLISTDKAVNPTNVMGASKRLAELVCESLDAGRAAAGADGGAGRTRFVIVRFGNVLGSSGSVVPKFKEQIAAGGPVTVTHPEVVRYFMSIPEAAQLVLQAGMMGDGGEIFVLDMGEPVRIAYLAREMIRLSGFSEEDIRIEFTGLRPGEKLFEELLADSESTLPTPHPKLRIVRPSEVPDAAWRAGLLAWLQNTGGDMSALKADLRRQLPEYRPEPPRGTGQLGSISTAPSPVSGWRRSRLHAETRVTSLSRPLATGNQEAQMSRFLVTGAMGFIGRHLCAHLVKQGHVVRATLRKGPPPADFPAKVTWTEVGTIGPGTDWAAALDGVAYVIHLAALAHQIGERGEGRGEEFMRVNGEGTRRLAEAVAGASSAARLVYVSSVKAVRSVAHETITLATLPEPDTDYGRSKLAGEAAIEEVLRETYADSCIIRAPLVYGPGNPGNMARLGRLVQTRIPLPLAGVNNQRSFVFVGNLVDALERCATHPGASRQTFLISDGEVLSTPELMRRLAYHTGVAARLFAVPERLLGSVAAVGDVASRILGRSVGIDGYSLERLIGSLAVDTSSLTAAIGWRPPFTMDEGLRATFQHERNGHGS